MSSENLSGLRNELKMEDKAYQAAVGDFDAAVARAVGVNRTDLRCLEILYQQGPSLPSRLGKRLGLTTGSVTAMLDRLERIGYLTRRSDPSDRRQVLVQITPKATSRMWNRHYKPLVQEGFQGIAQYSAAELAVVLDYLRRGRELYGRHLLRIRNMPPPERHRRQRNGSS